MRRWHLLVVLSAGALACNDAESPMEISQPGLPQFSISSVPAGAIVVNDGGNDCGGAVAVHTTISAAVTAAPAASTIYVCPGAYPEIVEINKVLWVFGPQHDVDARMRSGEPEAVVGTAGGAFRIRSSHVQLNGFTVQGAIGGAGVDMANTVAAVVVSNNIIEKNTFGMYLNSSGPTYSHVFRNAIRNNNAAGTHSGYGIYGDQGTRYVHMIENHFTGHASGAVRLQGGAGTQSNVNMYANELEDEGPLFFFRVTDLYLEGNTVHRATGDAVVLGGANSASLLYYNRFQDGTGSAVRVSNDGSGVNNGLLLYQNCISGNAWGVKLDAGAHHGGAYAENGWWGHPGGPNVNGGGPGAGDDIADPDHLIDYSPWLTDTPFGCEALDAEGPITSNVAASANPVQIGVALQLTAYIDDAMTGGSTIAGAEYSINGGNWLPMGVSDGGYDEIAEAVTAALAAPAEPVVLQICVRGTDAAGNTGAAECIVLAVYDPSAGFVTGGGWITSPAGACQLTNECAAAEGKATFGFVARYHKGASTPNGETQFLFHAGGMHLKSTSYDWLVVAGAKAQFKGVGTVNGAGDYGFLLSTLDGQVNGGGDTDRLRLKVWDRATGAIVYDNQMGDPDSANATTVLGGGSIVVHAQ